MVLPIASPLSFMPQLQIRMQRAELGINVERGQTVMSQPAADLTIRQPQAEQYIRQPKGELTIDQTRAWDALGKPKPTVFMRRIADQSWGVAAEGVRGIVQKGNMMAAIHENRNVFAEIGKSVFPFRGNRSIQYTARPSMMNVDISYTARPPIIEHEMHEPIIEARINKPYIDIEPNRVHIYMKQWPSLEFIPPKLDVTV